MYVILLISIFFTIIYSIKLLLLFKNIKYNKKIIYYKLDNFLIFILIVPLFCIFISFYVKFNYILINLNIFNYYLVQSNINSFYIFKLYYYSFIPMILIILFFIYILLLKNLVKKKIYLRR